MFVCFYKKNGLIFCFCSDFLFFEKHFF